MNPISTPVFLPSLTPSSSGTQLGTATHGPKAASSGSLQGTPAIDNQGSSRPGFYQKNGKLTDLNIKEQLLFNLEEGQLAKIEPHDPAFYLRPVWKNSALKNTLQTYSDPGRLKSVEELCQAIDRGDWGAVRHLHQWNTASEGSAAHDMRIKDMLLIAHAAGRISAAEFATAHMVLNLREQFEKEITPDYVFADKTSAGLQSTRLPVQDAQVTMCRLFELNADNEKVLTDDGFAYLDMAIDNVEELNKKLNHAIENFDPSQWLENLQGRLMDNVPENLQIFFHIKRTGAAEGFGKKDFWKDQVSDASTMPFAAPLNPDDDYFFSASSAILHEFHILLRPAQVVQPVLCLGTVGAKRLAQLHLKGFHPVVVRDDRIKTNYGAPHGYPAGALYGSMHDDNYHCMAVTLYTHAQRQFSCVTAIQAVEKAIKPGNEFEAKIAENFINYFADLPVLQRGNFSPDMIADHCFYHVAHDLGVGKEVKNKALLSDNRDDDQRKMIQFMTKCLDEIKNCRTGRIPNETLRDTQSWERTEALLQDLENKLGNVSSNPGSVALAA